MAVRAEGLSGDLQNVFQSRKPSTQGRPQEGWAADAFRSGAGYPGGLRELLTPMVP
jgi:hypothetical protein